MSHNKILSCKTIPESLTIAPVVNSCTVIESGALRLETVFQYPDGSYIDIFLEHTDDLIHQYKLTDYGQTSTYLMDLPLNPWGTAKRKKITNEICKRLGVSASDGELSILLGNEDMVSSGLILVRLAQACIRISDLGLTKRLRSINSFRDDVEEFVSQCDLPYEMDVKIIGRFDNPIRFDFAINGKTTNTLIQTLSTEHTSAAHQIANEVFRRWFDVESVRSDWSFISLYNSESQAFRDEDLMRLEAVSTVFGFPAQAEAIAETMVA